MVALSRGPLVGTFHPLKIALGTAIIVLSVGAVYLSTLIFERQEMLAKVSRYNVAWSAGQGVNEFSRLRQRVSELAAGEGSKQEAQLRFEIVKNRLELFRSGEFQPFVLEADDRQTTVESLSNFLHRAEMLIEQVENPATARAILSEMVPLEGDLIGL
ncbi:MAG: diguanylate cyclase, partial [Mesorhizobium sp.]